MNKLFKISSIALAFSLCPSGAILAFATHEDVKEVLADSEPEFYIGSQDMIANPIYNDGLGGSATLDESDAAYTLTLNNFTYNDAGHTNTLDGSSNLYSAAIFCNYLGKKNVVIKLIGTSNINLTTTTSNCNDGIAIHNSDNKSSSLTIETDESQSERARLNVSVSNGAGKTTRAIFCENNKRLYFDNCLIYATGGNNKTTSGVYARGGLTIEETAEIHATGGSTTNLTSFGLFVANSNFRMNGGIIYATGGNVSSTGKSIGAQIYGSVPATQDAGELVAVGGSSESGDSVGFYSLGTYNFNGGKITAIGGTSSSGSSYGIQHNQYSTTSTAIPSIGNNIERLLATGDTMAIQARMKNSLRGLGWDNVSGTGGPTVISINSSEGQKFDGYKKVILNQIKYVASANPSVDYDGSSHSSVNVSVSFPTSGYSISYKGPEDLSYSSTVPSFVNSGTYAVDYKIEASDFPTEMGTLNFTINKLDPTITAPVLAENVDYDGSSHNALASNGSATGGTLKFRVGSTGDLWETAPLTFSHAGNYQIFYKVFGDSNHNDSEIIELGTFTIRMAEITNVSVSQVGALTYNGLAQTATVSASATTVNSQAYTFTYSASEGGTYTSSVPSFTNAGSHTVYYKVSADNHVTSTGQFEVAIGKANAVLTAPVGKTGLTYTGSPQDLLDSLGSTTLGSIEYKINAEGTYSTSIPQATYPGTYTVYYRVLGTSNYNGVAESSLDVTISNAKITNLGIGPVPDLHYTEEGSSPDVTITANTVDGTTPTISYRIKDSGDDFGPLPVLHDAGNYKIEFKLSAPYHDDRISTFTVKMLKGTTSISTEAAAIEGLVYNGQPQELVTPGYAVGGDLIYRIGTSGSFSEEIPTGTDVGYYYVYYKINPNENYENTYDTIYGAYCSPTYIAPATITNVSVSQVGTLSYDGTPKTAVVSTSATTVDNCDVTFTYSDTSDGTYTSSVPSFIEAGSHTVYYKVSADNHVTATGSFTVAINPASSSYTITPSAKDDLVYDGSAQALVNAGSTSDGEIQYSVNGGAFSTTIPTATLPGTYSVSYKIVGDGNHLDTDPVALDPIVISPAEITSISVTQSGTLVYTGEAITPIVDASATSVGGEEVAFTYCDTPTGEFTTSLPIFTNAGTYTVYYKASAANHLEVSGSFEITINKANSALLQAPTAVEGLVVNGESLALVNAGSTSSGTIVYRLGETGEFTTSIPTASEAGTYVVQYKILGDANHNDSQIYSISVTISEAPVTPVTPSEGETGSSSNFPTWLIPIIIVVGVLVLLGIIYLLTFFVFNKWAMINSKPTRIVKIGKKDDKVKVLTNTFTKTLLDDSEILKSKNDCLK